MDPLATVDIAVVVHRSISSSITYFIIVFRTTQNAKEAICAMATTTKEKEVVNHAFKII